jgi:hypothetical protein
VEGTSQVVLGCSDPVEGTSQPVTISKKWKNLSSASRRKRTLSTDRPFHDFQPVPSAYQPQAHRSQIMEGPVLRAVSYTY